MTNDMRNKVHEVMVSRGYVRAIDAARRIGVVPSTIYGWIREKRVNAKRIKNATYVTRRSLIGQLGEDRAELLRVDLRPESWEMPA